MEQHNFRQGLDEFYSNKARSNDESSDTFAQVRKLIEHYTSHVIDHPVIIEKFDMDCWLCQILFDRITKRSKKSAEGASLNGAKPAAIVQYTTLLCSIGMHEECLKDYVRPKFRIELTCLCECHQQNELKREVKNRKMKRKQKRTTH